MSCSLCSQPDVGWKEEGHTGKHFCNQACQKIHYGLIGAGEKRDRSEAEPEGDRIDYFSTLPRDALVAIFTRFESIDELINVCSTNRRFRELCKSELFRLNYIHYDPKRSWKTAYEWLSARDAPTNPPKLSDIQIEWLKTMELKTDKYEPVIDQVVYFFWALHWHSVNDYDFRTGIDIQGAAAARSWRFEQVFFMMTAKDQAMLLISIADNPTAATNAHSYSVKQLLDYGQVMPSSNYWFLFRIVVKKFPIALLYSRWTLKMPEILIKNIYEKYFNQIQRALQWLPERVKEIVDKK